jgi:hypothetical protein
LPFWENCQRIIIYQKKKYEDFKHIMPWAHLGTSVKFAELNHNTLGEWTFILKSAAFVQSVRASPKFTKTGPITFPLTNTQG